MSTGRRLRIGSLNVWNPGGPGREEGLANLMKQADVVLLQELRDARLLAELAQRAGLPHHKCSSDVGIASRFPMDGFKPYSIWRVPNLTPVRSWFQWTYTPFCYASIPFDGRKLHVISNHWAHGSERFRMESLKLAMKALTALPKEDLVIFGGDFNATPEMREVSLLRQCDLVDCFHQVPGCRHTEPRVDQIYIRGKVEGVHRYEAQDHVPPNQPTDHPFLLVELSLPPSP
jgi:endonuclease/exonuclease/phosphatase (EEP) superfamily protein YafD